MSKVKLFHDSHQLLAQKIIRLRKTTELNSRILPILLGSVDRQHIRVTQFHLRAVSALDILQRGVIFHIQQRARLLVLRRVCLFE